MNDKILSMEEKEHKMFHRKLAYVFILIVIMLLGGAIFYHYAEKWRYLDAIYFSAYTITTVGYGDFVPKSDLGKIFTIFYIFAGVAIALYGLSLLASHFVEVREEFWLESLGKMRIKHRTKTFWEKVKDLIAFKSVDIIREYEKSKKR